MDDTGFHGRSASVFAVSVIFIVLSTVFTIFRIISRSLVVKKVTPDDYLIIVAWVIAFGLSFACCYGTTYGLGRHEGDVPESWQATLRETTYAFSVLYQPALMATKTSILLFYLKLSTERRTFKWACIITMIVVNAGGLALTMLTVFQCRPIRAAFQPASAGETGHCTDVVTIYLSSAPLNLITDLAIFFLPMPILTGMRLPKKTKIILVITFSFGIFAAAVDVIRVAYLQSAFTTRLQEIANSQPSGPSRTQDRTDFSWYASFSFMWSVVEVNVGIMVASVPALKPLVSRFLPSLLKDPGELSEKSRTGSLGVPVFEPSDASDSPVPTLPDDVRHRDFCKREEEEAEEPDGPMGMMDFLSMPESTGMARIERSQTAKTNTSRYTRPDSPTFFDFVNMSGQKSLVHMTMRESIFPISMVTVVFFIWGFEYGLIAVLNAQFQRVAHMTAGQTISIHSAYFAGYLFGPPLIGYAVLKHWGFRGCYVVGLTVYACGTLIYWPAAVLTSFPAFVITNFLVAMGLSVLEVAANPFIALCGPAEYAEIRLNLSQGIQAIGSVVAPLIAHRAFFRESLDDPSLVNTQWAYLGIALITMLLAVAYFYVPLPEATDSELEDASERLDNANKTTLFSGRVPIIFMTLALAVLSQFLYVGAQEVNSTSFSAYMTQFTPNLNTTNFLAIGHTAFALSRFLAAGLGFWIKPRYLLLFFYTGAMIFEALAMHFSDGTGLAMLIMVYFMEGPLFSLIFAQALRGMGRHTKLASVAITAAVSGGAVFAPISNELIIGGRRSNSSLVVGVVVLGVGLIFPLFLNLTRKAAKQVDPVWKDSKHGKSDQAGSRQGLQEALQDPAIAGEKNGNGEGSNKVGSRTLAFLHSGGTGFRRSKEGSEAVERREYVDDGRGVHRSGRGTGIEEGYGVAGPSRMPELATYGNDY